MARPAKRPAALAALDRLAWWLDEAFEIPWLGRRVGLDAILGLVPGAGDALGAILSSAFLVTAIRLGVDGSTILRMGLNILVESLVGVVPLAGDLFDAGWKANRRNVELLERHLAAPARTRRTSRLTLAALAALVVGAALAGTALVAWAIAALIAAIT